MENLDNTPPLIKILALVVVGSVAKALFAPPRVYNTHTVERVTDAAKDLIVTAKGDKRAREEDSIQEL